MVGNAAAQGALGGDRVGVAQANLASQQTASQAPIIAGLYDKSYQSGLGVAQQQQQNQGNAAYSIGNLGVAGQNAALSGANAQVGAGNLMQGNEQQRLNALYQQYQIAQAFPYQQTQWLAGIDTGVGSQLGGTSQTTGPAPNPLASILGLGVAGAGVAGGLGWKPFAAQGGRIPGFAPGGSVEGPFAGVGWVPTRQITMGHGAPPPPNATGAAGSGMDLAKMGLSFAGRPARDRSAGVPISLAAPGVASFSPSEVGSVLPIGMAPQAGFGDGPIYRDGGGVRGFAFGGAPAMETTGLIPNFNPSGGFQDTWVDRWAPVPEAIRAGVAGGGFDPQGSNFMTGEPPTASNAGVVPIPRERPLEAPQAVAGFGLGEDTPTPLARPIAAPASDMDTGETLSLAPTVGAGDAPVGGLAPAQTSPWGAVVAAGLGMMASRSPFLANAVGEGGLAGLNSYAQQKQADLQHAEKRDTIAQGNRRLDNETKRLDQAAEQARKALEETTRHHGATEGLTKSAQELQRERLGLQPGYRWNADRTAQEPIPGGAADPATIKAAADAKRGSAGLLDEETIGTMAGQYLSGDKSVMQNLGRGAQGAENIVKLRAEITRQAKEAGLKPDQIATKMADFAGRTAAMRALGTRGVNVEYAANTANKAIDLAQEASDKVPRTQFVPFNKLKQLVETNTSSPEQAAFYTATNTLVNEYARVASGGSNQATEGMRHHAREMLNTAQGPAAYKAVLGMMRREIQTAKSAYNETRQEFLSDSHARDEKAGAPAAPASTGPRTFKSPAEVQAAVKGGTLKKGDRFLDSAGVERVVP